MNRGDVITRTIGGAAQSVTLPPINMNHLLMIRVERGRVSGFHILPTSVLALSSTGAIALPARFRRLIRPEIRLGEHLRPMSLAAEGLLDTTEAAVVLAEELVRARALPAKAADDALHIAIAATQKIPYLLTWNCRHMANATMRPVIEAVCASKGYKAPIICTPEELRKELP